MRARTSCAVQRRLTAGIPIMCFYEKGLESKPTVVGVGVLDDVRPDHSSIRTLGKRRRRWCRLVSVQTCPHAANSATTYYGQQIMRSHERRGFGQIRRYGM